MLGHASLRTTQVYTRVALVKLNQIHSATHPGARLARHERVSEAEDELVGQDGQAAAAREVLSLLWPPKPPTRTWWTRPRPSSRLQLVAARLRRRFLATVSAVISPRPGVPAAVRVLLLALVAAVLPAPHASASLPSLGDVARFGEAAREREPLLAAELERELPGPCAGALCGERERVQPKTRVRGFELDLYCRLGGEQGLSCRPRQVWAEEYGEGTSDQSLFTGHYFDTETNLYYAKARYFDPQLGRFLSQDSYLGELTEPPSLHRYLYAHDRPTYWADPTGHAPGVAGAYEFIDWLKRTFGPGESPAPAPAVDPEQVTSSAGVRWRANVPRREYRNERALELMEQGHLNLAELAEAGHGCAYCHLVKEHRTLSEADAALDLERYNQSALFMGATSTTAELGLLVQLDLGSRRAVSRPTNNYDRAAWREYWQAYPAEARSVGAAGSGQSKRAAQAAANRAAGDAWEAELIESELPKTQRDIQPEITVKSLGPSGMKTRLDAVGTEVDTGAVALTEGKASATAPLTPNQKVVHPELEVHGGVVVGEGKPPYVGGTVIPPTKVVVKRRP